jgi:hypothetical protein
VSHNAFGCVDGDDNTSSMNVSHGSIGFSLTKVIEYADELNVNKNASSQNGVLVYTLSLDQTIEVTIDVMADGSPWFQ